MADPAWVLRAGSGWPRYAFRHVQPSAGAVARAVRLRVSRRSVRAPSVNGCARATPYVHKEYEHRTRCACVCVCGGGGACVSA